MLEVNNIMKTVQDEVGTLVGFVDTLAEKKEPVMPPARVFPTTRSIDATIGARLGAVAASTSEDHAARLMWPE